MADKPDKIKTLQKESKRWKDTFHIPRLDLFYRKDELGIWYDHEGMRISSPFILKDQFLISLNGKVYKESIAFKNQKIYSNKQNKLVQVGKIVFDELLEPLLFQGRKITAIGHKTIEFSEDDALQEVILGRETKAFIHLSTKKAFLINNKTMKQHIASIALRENKLEIFSDGQSLYAVVGSSKNVLNLDDQIVRIKSPSMIQLGSFRLIQAFAYPGSDSTFYVDLDHLASFQLESLKHETIQHIDPEFVEINGQKWYNLQTDLRQLVFNPDKQIFYQSKSTEGFECSFKKLEGFEQHFCQVFLKDQKYIYNKTTEDILQVGNMNIRDIITLPHQKLLNAQNELGENIVLDARAGLHQLQLAKSQAKSILSVLGEAQALGSKILQRAEIATLGGHETRYIDLNDADLSIFTLPKDLKSYTEQSNPSLYSENPILNIDFNNQIQIDQHTFVSAQFLSFTDRIEKIILQCSNGEPLHFVGAKHKNELVSFFIEDSLKKEYYLGKNRMIQCQTLDEAGQQQQLLFSLDQLNSWLPFYDSFLPILKNIVEIKDATDWDYYLFELRERHKENHYIAVEKEAPYRILAERKASNVVPKIVKSSNMLLQIPEEVSALRKLFLNDPGILIQFE